MLETHYYELRNFLAGKLKDADAAADLAQESYLRVLAMQQAGEVVEQPRALLYRIANNLIVDRYRRAEVRDQVMVADDQLAEFQVAAPSAWEPEIAAMSAQGIESLLKTIDSLPPRCREVFILYKFDGLSYAGIGERMSISVRTVEMQLQIAMAACWACLERINPE
jgi:RNA polymerase sigma factor (sigma-70 family)